MNLKWQKQWQCSAYAQRCCENHSWWLEL